MLIRDSLKTIATSLMVLSLVGVAYAWTEPTSTPPDGNLSSPLTNSGTAQTKSGGLWLNSGGASTGLIVENGNVGIGITTPEAKLHVNGGWVYLTGTGQGADPATRIGINDSDNAGGISGWWLSQNQDGKFAIHQNGVGDRLTIDGAGNVSINNAGAGLVFPDGTIQTTAGSGSIFVTGKYIGNGVDNREIAVGFQPDDVETGIVNVLNYEILHRNKYMEIGYSQGYASATWTTGGIKNFTANGFTIGNGSTMNESGRTYWYKAFKGGTPPAFAAPVINSISISPNPIGIGQSTTISWSSSNAVSCTASGQWSGAKSANGSQSVTPPLGAAVTYTLTCYNSDASQSDTKSATVEVRDWVATSGSGNYGETCDSWLSRTGQAGINGSLPLYTPNSLVGKCLYGTPDGTVQELFGFGYFSGGGQGLDYYGPLPSNTSDSRILPFSWHCCGNVSGTEAATLTTR